MATNPLKWSSFEQLGKDFCENLQPALEQLAANKDELDDTARMSLARLESWLSAPCSATVKLDGTNVGVDNFGLLVGRNTVVEPGANYQKVDLKPLREGYPAKAEGLRTELSRQLAQASASEDCKEDVRQVMLYGELVVNGKYDYSKAGIFKDWLCFGVVVCPSAQDDEAVNRLAFALRALGYNARACEDKVRLTPNAKLVVSFSDLGIRTVSDVYTPTASITGVDWAAHDGTGTLPCFRSLRRLLLSEWAQRFLLPADGVPVGEGLVVASEADGRLFKWKHAGEDLGKVPDQLREATEVLRRLPGTAFATDRLPTDLLEIFERLLLVATTTPKAPAAQSDSKKAVKQEKAGDSEALLVWESALTKFDILEAAFERGNDAKTSMEKELIDQVASDLMKDYDAAAKDARARATRVVRTEMGKRFGIWKKSQESSIAGEKP